ncbi:hypothetical protein D3C78_1846460 [compost metagenome]
MASNTSLAAVSSINCLMCLGLYTCNPAMTRPAMDESSSINATGNRVRPIRKAATN